MPTHTLETWSDPKEQSNAALRGTCRLNVVPVHVPPLRERVEDVTMLAEEFMRRFSRKHGVHAKGFTDGALQI